MLLRFDDPIGSAGFVIHLVTTNTFKTAGSDSTLMKISVLGAGEIEDGNASIVEKVWWHFIFEQLKQFIESSKHLDE